MSSEEDDSKPPTTEELAAWALTASQKELHLIEQVIRLRRKALREMKNWVHAQELYVGDRVQLSVNLRPRKLAGKLGHIRDILPPKKGGDQIQFVVDLEEHIEGWPSIRVEAASITKTQIQ